MVSNNDNISILVKILKENNIRDIVISPGGTNINFVNAVQDDPFFTCYSIVDERSAIYFAIGLYLQKGTIIATSCTSAQATRNYVPGLTEAYYKHVPILAITMAKHPRFTYQEYMQAPDQTSLPKDCVKKSYAVPFISDENDKMHSIRVINQAILELTHNGYGPVQLCIPSLDSPLGSEVKNIRVIRRHKEKDVVNCINRLKNKKVMIAIGEHRKFDKKLVEAIEKFASSYNCCIYTNHLSNFHSKYACNTNLSLIGMKKDEFMKVKPDILITIGGQTGDYPFYKMLSKIEFNDIEHWRISCDGNVVDTYDKLTDIFEMEEEEFFSSLILNENSVDNFYLKAWKKIEQKQNTDIPLPFSNAYIAQQLSKKIKNNSIIQFSILNSLRMWNMFKLDPSVECYSNVAAFGIDGGMSTLIGQSVVTNKDCYMVVGDLAFLYDINSLSIRHIKNNVKIILINNNGGVEFKLYPNAGNFKKINKYTAAGNHFKNAEGWANTCGFKYISAKDKNEFDKKIDEFISESSQSILFEVFVKDEDEVKAYNNLIDNNTNYNIGDIAQKTTNKIKSKIKKIIRR